MSELTVEAVTTAEALEALAPAWTDLWQRASDATPFQAPAWLIPWWRHIGQGELLALCAWADDALVGLLPAYVCHEPSERKLLPLGIGISDWLDALAAPGREREVGAALLSAIAQRVECFDVCDLRPLATQSCLLDADPAGLVDERVTLEPRPRLCLPAAGAEFRSVLPKAMRQNLSYYRRRADKHGRLSFESAARPDSLAELLQALYDLHGARWRREGLTGVLADPAVRAFHLEAAAQLFDRGVLRLYGLRLDERIAAAAYGFLAKGRFCLYLTGFDPDLASLGLGTLIIGHALEQVVLEGAQEFDFLRGGEAYKYRWGATDRPSYGRRLRAPA